MEALVSAPLPCESRSLHSGVVLDKIKRNWFSKIWVYKAGGRFRSQTASCELGRGCGTTLPRKRAGASGATASRGRCCAAAAAALIAHWAISLSTCVFSLAHWARRSHESLEHSRALQIKTRMCSTSRAQRYCMRGAVTITTNNSYGVIQVHPGASGDAWANPQQRQTTTSKGPSPSQLLRCNPSSPGTCMRGPTEQRQTSGNIQTQVKHAGLNV